MIPTRPLQILSTAVLGACGIVTLFAPEVFLSAISMADVVPHWPMQLLAAAWLSLAMFDWILIMQISVIIVSNALRFYRLGLHHTRIDLRADDFLAELPNTLKAVDSPSGDGLNTYVVSKVTRQSGIKVALSGLGGDELFAGYHYFRRWLDIKSGILPRIPSAGRRLAATALAATGRSKLERMADILATNEIDIASVYPRTRQVISRRSASSCSPNGFPSDPVQQMLLDKRGSLRQFPLLSQFTIAELLGYTQNVLLKDVDQFSMASALEVREPFFDHHLVEYMLQVPDKYKLSDTPKCLLVEALGDMLPRSIVDRKKMGFVFPFEKWMRGELKEFCDTRIQQLADRDIFNADTLTEKWKKFSNGQGNVRWSELWHLVVLTDWLETNKF